jgi:hypothetical protein
MGGLILNRYTGVDIVPSLIEDHKKRHGTWGTFAVSTFIWYVCSVFKCYPLAHRMVAHQFTTCFQHVERDIHVEHEAHFGCTSQVLDLTQDRFPSADLVICRDVLFHNR